MQLVPVLRRQVRTRAVSSEVRYIGEFPTVNSSITRTGYGLTAIIDEREWERTSIPISLCLLTSDGKKNRSPADSAASKRPGNAEMISEALMTVTVSRASGRTSLK